MTTKFLSPSSNGDLSNGSSNILAATLSATNLSPSTALRTSSAGVITSSNIEITDVNGLTAALAAVVSHWSRGGTLVIPANIGDSIGFDTLQSVNGVDDIVIDNTIDCQDNIKTDQISESTGSAGIICNHILDCQDNIKTDQISESTGSAGVKMNNTVNLDYSAGSSLLYTDASKDIGDVTLSSNLSLTTGTLDTIQDIQTTSTPTFDQISATTQVNSDYYACTCGSMTIDSYDNTADSVLNIINSDGTYKCDCSIEGQLVINNSAFSSPYVFSLQSSVADTWMEILNISGSGKGVFFGITNDSFELWNFQAGPINFYTGATASTGTNRLSITNGGDVQIKNLTASRLVYSGPSNGLKSVSLGSNLDLTAGTLSIIASPVFTNTSVTTTLKANKLQPYTANGDITLDVLDTGADSKLIITNSNGTYSCNVETEKNLQVGNILLVDNIQAKTTNGDITMNINDSTGDSSLIVTNAYAGKANLSVEGAITATSIQLSSTTTVSSILDQDDMSSNSNTALCTQQSIKAYVDSSIPSGYTPSFFLSYLASVLNTVTGDTTVYTVAYDTVSYDYGTDFDGTTFTAPSDGYYRFTFYVALDGFDASHTDILIAFAGTAIYQTKDYHNQINQVRQFSIVRDMYLSATNTVTSRVIVNGSGKTINIKSGAGTTFFCGQRFA